MKNPALWKEKYDVKKEDGQKGASWINIMSLEALIDLWKIPTEDAYRILNHREGDFIVAKFYYGEGVFRLLTKREADMSKYDQKKKEYYKNVITKSRKYKIVKDYFEDLIKRANYRDYGAERARAEKVEEIRKKSLIIIETNRGDIEVELFPAKAPKACENFISLVEKKYYDGIMFHRAIKDFMIQGGDPTGTGTGGDSIWGGPFEDEISGDNNFDEPGLLAMANSGPDTNKSQFFITAKPTPWLNGKHTIFGKVVSGYNVVEKISCAETDASDKPKEKQVILKAYIKGLDDLSEIKEGGEDD